MCRGRRQEGGGNDNEEEKGVQLRGGRQMVSTLRSLPGDMQPVFTLLMEDKCQVVRIESVGTLTSNCSHQPSTSPHTLGQHHHDQCRPRV